MSPRWPSAYYPTLFQAEHTDLSALGMVRRLQQRTWIYFGVAVVVPPLAITVMAILSVAAENMPQWTFGVLGLVGLINSGLIFALSRAVQSALVSLAIAVSPPGTVTLGGGDSVSDSMWRCHDIAGVGRVAHKKTSSLPGRGQEEGRNVPSQSGAAIRSV